MIDSRYPYGEAFQSKLLSLLLQNPAKTSVMIQPHYFTSPLMADIARIVTECHKEHPDATFTYVFLKEAVKASLSRKARQNWPLYKKEIKAAVNSRLPDKSLFLEKAAEYAKQCIYREALVRGEICITAGDYKRFHEAIQKAEQLANFGATKKVHWRDLPHPSDYPHQEIEWIVDGLIPAGHAIAISGDEGVGKTLFLLSMARSITQGTDFLERRVSPAPVIYLGADVSKITLQNYMKMMRWNPGPEFRILTMWTDPEAPMLDSSEQLNWLYKYVEKYRPVLIFDTFRDFFDGEENSSTDTKPVLDAVKRIRSLGGTPIVITHPPKKGKSMIRGTGNISQKVDIPYFMERVKTQKKDISRLTCPTKNRAGSPNITLMIEKQFIQTPAGPYFRIRKVKDSMYAEREQNVQYAQLVAYLRENPGKNQKEIASNLRMSDRTAKKLLNEGKTKDELSCVKGERKTLLWSVKYSENRSGSVLKKAKSKNAEPR
jgi:RecA-family ATPase